MRDIIQDALTATRESKQIEFKIGFDPSSAGEWCEIVKDVVALANSGGGIIVFGLDSSGIPHGTDVAAICAIDPADISNKLSKYIGTVPIGVSVCDLEKAGARLAAFVVVDAETPVVFQKPGTYDIGGGKQKTAFSAGTIYFRHSAKSEPGTSDDIRRAIETRVNSLRKAWMHGVKKVVQAPRGAQVIVAVPSNQTVNSSHSASHRAVRVVTDPQAPAVHLTRDKTIAADAFVYEEISDGIFDEINNVIDANQLLAEGQQKFFLGPSIYYRIYAERKHVLQSDDAVLLLLRSAVFDFYAPCLYWVWRLPEKVVADWLAEIFLRPHYRATPFLMHFAILLGGEFSEWLWQAWDRKWNGYSQPPQFYRSFQAARVEAEKFGPLLTLTKTRDQTRIEVAEESPISVSELLANPKRAEELLSKVCMKEFRLQGINEGMRVVARILDVFAYGEEVRRHAETIRGLVLETVGDREPSESGVADDASGGGQ